MKSPFAIPPGSTPETEQPEPESLSREDSSASRSFSWRRFRKPGPAKAHGPVQGELSLDTVKPIRNELVDTDLEIVVTKRSYAANPFHRPNLNTGPMAGPARLGRWLLRIRSMLLGY